MMQVNLSLRILWIGPKKFSVSSQLVFLYEMVVATQINHPNRYIMYILLHASFMSINLMCFHIVILFVIVAFQTSFLVFLCSELHIGYDLPIEAKSL